MIKQIDQAISIYKHENPSFYNLPLDEQEKVISDLRENLVTGTGLDLPYLPRHVVFTWNALKFDWGELRSFKYSIPSNARL